MRELGVSPSDQFDIALIDLAPELPMYNERANAYIKNIMDEVKPDVLMVQGVMPSKLGVISMLKDIGQCHMSKRPTKLGSKNATVISDDLDVKDSTSMPLFGRLKKTGQLTELAPDILIDEIWVNDRPVCIYNVESMEGPLFEVSRLFIASKLAEDVYQKMITDPKNNPGSSYKNAIALLGGNLHAASDSESVQYLCGKQTRAGYAPSAFVDVWPELRVDPGVTERMMDVFDRSILLPKMVRPHRRTYFMTYGNVFGRAGSPMGIELNGMHSTPSGIPYSNTYGLDMRIFVPAVNQFIDPDSDED